jgi:hypothetical protein
VAEQLARYPLRPTVAAVNLDIFDLPQLLGRPLLPRPEMEDDTILAQVRTSLLEATALRGPGLDFAYLPDERWHQVRWTTLPSSLDPSFSVVIPMPGEGDSLQGCRPVPDAVHWRAPEPNLVHRILVGAPPGRDAEVALTAGAKSVARSAPLASTRIAAGSWTILEAQAPPGESTLSLKRLSGGMPCVESVVFGTAAR